jgi:hypothetical protein
MIFAINGLAAAAILAGFCPRWTISVMSAVSLIKLYDSAMIPSLWALSNIRFRMWKRIGALYAKKETKNKKTRTVLKQTKACTV